MWIYTYWDEKWTSYTINGEYLVSNACLDVALCNNLTSEADVPHLNAVDVQNEQPLSDGTERLPRDGPRRLPILSREQEIDHMARLGVWDSRRWTTRAGTPMVSAHLWGWRGPGRVPTRTLNARLNQTSR